jgi:NAD-dependent dihydropyrimidine dehydrogenase PreA subunit
MPYVINERCSETNERCSEKDAACVEVCPYDCIYLNKNAFLGQPLYGIDAEQCTDCGACALACPAAAIAPATEFGRYGGVPTYRNSAARDSHIIVTPTSAPAEMPALKVIMNEWADTFVASHV